MAPLFFVETALPPITLGQAPEMSFQVLTTLFQLNLSESDLKKTQVIREYIDINNVRKFLKKEPLDLRGNLLDKDLEEALVSHEILPAYLFDYLEKYKEVGEQIRNYSEVIAKFFTENIGEYKGFLDFYLCFERDHRLIMTAYRAKHEQRDLSEELQFEDFTDPIVAFLLAQKDQPSFEFPYEYQDLGNMISEAGEEPMKQYQSLAEFRFARVHEYGERKPFTIDFLLAYMVELLIAEDFAALNKDLGKQFLQRMNLYE